LLESIREPFLIHGHIVHASASIGFAVAIPGDTMATLLKQADMALYEAKNRGRDGMFQAGMGRVPMHDLADTAGRLYLV
jgi:GGDEF domain-containing protein